MDVETLANLLRKARISEDQGVGVGTSGESSHCDGLEPSTYKRERGA